jgi:hypothetical protein
MRYPFYLSFYAFCGTTVVRLLHTYCSDKDQNVDAVMQTCYVIQYDESMFL